MNSTAQLTGSHWLLVIDRHAARIFRSELRDAVPQQILPHEPDGYSRHEHPAKDFARGRIIPSPNVFFEPVAQALQSGGPILIFGTGTGNSSEMGQFIAWSKLHHPDLARRIVGSQVIDEHHLTDGQLIALARTFYAHRQTTHV